jgi:hypothetical protein
MATNYLERYLAGEYEQVWSELQALGPSVRQKPYLAEAHKVAAETMRRVRRNCERIVARLRASDYQFGVYPDGSTGYFTEGPLVDPSKEMRNDRKELEEICGPLPLSLVAFWQEVGSVDWVGMRPGWPDGLDPLVVYPPEGPLSDADSYEGEEGESFEGSLAPDDLHKDNVSGGDPYSVALPDGSADFVLLNERHNMLFVPYLRIAILHFGGFPGLEGMPPRADLPAELLSGLEPF